MRTFLSLEDALEEMTGGLQPLGVEVLPLGEALGRTLAEEVRAHGDQPPFDRSPLDGYALKAADTVGASPLHPVTLPVVETVYAGGIPSRGLSSGEAMRVMTGAILPSGCDCVLRLEDTDDGRETVSLYASLRPDANFCHRGEDYSAGTLLLPAGTRLDSPSIGVLASAGVFSVPVRRRPSVGLLVTGDEIVPPERHPLPPGKIYDANLSLLTARLRELGIVDIHAAHACDSPQSVAAQMEELLHRCDLLLTTGGVSVGDKDILHQALPLMGAEPVFWKVALKPGTPVRFSHFQGKPILSLSGNPFAAAATFELLARPMLAALSGESHFHLTQIQGRLQTPFPKSSPVRRFLRGRYQQGEIILGEHHSSGVLFSMLGCNCLVELPAGASPAVPGQTVTVWLL